MRFLTHILFEAIFGLCIFLCLKVEAQPSYILRTEAGHIGGISCAKFTPDGKIIATSATRDTVIQLWDGKTGKYLASLVGTGRGSTDFNNFNGISTFDISSSKLLASTSGDSVVQLWNIVSQKRFGSIEVTGNIQYIKFSTGGDLLLVVSNQGSVFLCSVQAKGILLKRTIDLQSYKYANRMIDANSDLSLLAYISDDDSTKIYDIAKDSVLWKAFYFHDTDPLFLQGDSIVITTDRYDSLYFHDAKSGRVLHAASVSGGNNEIQFYPCSKINHLFLSHHGYPNDTISYYNWESSTVENTMVVGYNTGVIAASPTDETFISGTDVSVAPAAMSYAGTASLYDLKKEQIIRDLNLIHGSSSASFSGNGQRYSINGDDRYITILQTEDGSRIRTIINLGQTYNLNGGQLSFDGSLIAYSEVPTEEQQSANYLHVYKYEVDPTSYGIQTLYDVTDHFHWSPTDTSVLYRKTYQWYFGGIGILRWKNGQLTDQPYQPLTNLKARDYDFSIDGKFIIAVSDSSQQLSLVNFYDNSVVTQLPLLYGKPQTVRSSPSADKALVIEKDSLAVLYDIIGGQSIQTFSIPQTTISDICYAKNGRYILTSHSDGTIRIWDIASGNSVFTYDSLGGAILDIDLSNDGNYILASTDQGFVQLLKAIGQLGVESYAASPSPDDISIYPNPASDKITIELSDGEGDSIHLYDELGKQVNIVKGQYIDRSHFQLTIDLLPAGSYILKTHNKIGRFIIAR